MNKAASLYFTLLLFCLGCHSGSSPERDMDAPVSAQAIEISENPAGSGFQSSPVPVDTTKKLIKEGDITFQTTNLEETRVFVLGLTEKLGGYVSEERQNSYPGDNRRELNLIVRIPAATFDTLMQDISREAYHVDSKNIRVMDVTAGYIDNKTRLENKKALEKRYLELLGQAKSIEDILSIENKLAGVRSEIESSQSQFDHLSRQIAYSTLHITFYTRSLIKGDGFFAKLKNAVAGSFDLLSGLFFGAITIWPLIALMIILVWLTRRYMRRRKRE